MPTTAADANGVFQNIATRLAGRDSRKIGNNTYLHTCADGSVAIRLHATDVLTFRPDGTTVATSGGWKTPTTKDRINSYLPHGWRVYQTAGQWHWHKSDNWSNTTPDLFTDGDTIAPDGTLHPQAKPEDGKASRKLRKSILAYARLCAASLPLEAPGGGDCWHCYFETQGGKSLGDSVVSTDHFLSHMEEGYVVPSLVFRALREAGNTDTVIAGAFREDAGFLLDIARDRTRKAVAQYLYRRFGLPAGGGRA